jgi:hypothetical protein
MVNEAGSLGNYFGQIQDDFPLEGMRVLRQVSSTSTRPGRKRVIYLEAIIFGVLAGIAVDARIRSAATREGSPLDRHLDGGRWRRLLVPLLAGVSCLSAALRWGSDPVLIPFLFFLPLLAGLAMVDLHTRRLPNVLTGPALLGGSRSGPWSPCWPGRNWCRATCTS